MIFKDLQYGKNINLLLQEYNKEKLDIISNKIQVTIRFLDLRNWAIDEPIELLISNDCTYLEFGNIINSYYPNLKV